MSTWFDNTTYPPGAQGRIAPLSWYMHTGRLGISVVRRGEDVWFMICGDIGMHDYELLEAKTVMAAQNEAVEIVRYRLREKINSLPRSSDAAEQYREDAKSLPRKQRGSRGDEV